MRVDGGTTATMHVYTFMHPQDNKALFLMRNPWGHNPDFGGSKDGVLRITDHVSITSTIDLRIVGPGIAAKKGATVESN